MGKKEDELGAKLGTLAVKTSKRRAPSAEINKEEGEEEEPVSPAARLLREPGFNCHIVSVIGVGTRIDVDVVKSGLESTLVRHPRFSSIPVFDEKGNKAAKWVKTKVVVDDHIVIPDLDPAGAATSTSPDRLVEDYVSSLCGTPMDASRPLWELHILNFSTSDAAAVAVFRIHHSLGDGVSLTSLLLACTRKVSDPTSLPTLPVSSQPPVPRIKPGPLTFLRSFLILIWHTLVDIVLFIATSTFLKDSATPLKGTSGVAERPKRFVHRIVSLDDIKDVKDAAKCTVNDVLLGVTSAALTRYIVRRCGGTGSEDNRKKLRLPRNIRLRSIVLVNIRPTTGLHDLSEFMEGKNSGVWWGNRLGYAILPFPIVSYEDPLDYVRKGKAIADRKKNSLESIFTHKSAMLMVKYLGMRATVGFCGRMFSNTTFSFSNIVGPVEAIGFYGHPIAYIAPSVYGHPHALTVHFQSYKNTMTIVLAVDESAIPDPHQLLDDFVQSLKLIKGSIPPKS